MRLLVLDGQGGGVGRSLVEGLKAALPDQEIIAVGLNAAATAAMLRAGADAGATGENAVVYNCRRADVILGPIGILTANAMLGEVTEKMAVAVGSSEALKIVVPIQKCHVEVAGLPDMPIGQGVFSAVEKVQKLLGR